MGTQLETLAMAATMDRDHALRRAERRARLTAGMASPSEQAATARELRAWRLAFGRPVGAVPAVLALLVAAVLLVASMATAVAQGATPAATPAVALPPFVEAYGAAWSSGDPSQVIALYAEDAVFTELVLDGVVTTSHEELAAYATAAFVGFTDFAITPTAGFVAGDMVAIEWVLSGTYTGTFGTLPPGTGQAVAVPGASIIRLEDGLIVEQREYWDVATLLSQVGLM